MIRARSRSAFLGAVAAATGAAALPRLAVAQPTTLRMASVMSDALGEAFFAKEAGSFARAGFEIDVTSLNNAALVVAAIGGGSLELGIGDLVSGVKAIVAGVPIVLIAGSGLYVSKDGDVILGAAKDGAIHGPRDLIGKSLAVPTLVGLTTVALRAWLAQNGVDLATVKFVEVPQPTIPGAIQRGTVDAGILSDPFITPYRNDIRDIGHPYDAIAQEFLISVWYASRSWIEADRARARRVVNAIYDTARWANAHHAATFDILVREGHLDPEKLHGMIRIPFATSLTPAIVQPVLNIAAQYKILDTVIDANTIIAKL